MLFFIITGLSVFSFGKLICSDEHILLCLLLLFLSFIIYIVYDFFMTASYAENLHIMEAIQTVDAMAADTENQADGLHVIYDSFINEFINMEYELVAVLPFAALEIRSLETEIAIFNEFSNVLEHAVKHKVFWNVTIVSDIESSIAYGDDLSTSELTPALLAELEDIDFLLESEIPFNLDIIEINTSDFLFPTENISTLVLEPSEEISEEEISELFELSSDLGMFINELE